MCKPMLAKTKRVLSTTFVTIPSFTGKKRLPLVVGLFALRSVFALFLFCVAVDLNVVWLFGSSPTIRGKRPPELAFPSEVYSRDGVLLGRYYTTYRLPLAGDSIPQHFKDALLATEDIRFYHHHGVELRTPFMILFSSVAGDSRGGSTITQQLAKNLFLTRSQKSRGLLGWIPGVSTIIYKTKEWITALKLEAHYTKPEILELYCTTVNFGTNSYGIVSAAKTYFNKRAADLSVAESALLVGMLKAPTNYSPLLHPEKAKERRSTVLAQMKKYRFITHAYADSLDHLPLTITLTVDAQDEGDAAYFRAALAPVLQAWCKNNKQKLYTGGLKIYTTIDSRIQLYAEEAVEHELRRLQALFDDHFRGINPWTDRHNRELVGFADSLVKHTVHYQTALQQFGNNTKAITAAMHRKVRDRIESGARPDNKAAR